ncbi:hypothetical protein EIP91_004649 [Steccherinum ochraceum]|uniref:NAD(P)-binding protein n=1 Tax=Steccherinum ochraceum TaxID=92696 RepID=A0A4R0RWD7_9APHY|nr:hypothetical protein EIP91_004649 [Steccherinum ochraceum]
MSSQQQPKVWFVTGSSTGLGRCLVEYLLSKSEIVVATLRKPEVLNDLKAKYPTTQLLILRLDVANRTEVDAAFEKVKVAFGHLDVVVNNAGRAMLSEVEGFQRKMPALCLTPGVGGRLFNISSVSGLHPSPETAFYSASKFALEALTQSLAAELDPEWKIKVTIIEPGTFETEVFGNGIDVPIHPKYNKPGLPAVVFRDYLAKRKVGSAGDPVKAVAKFYELAQLPEPPMRLALGKDAIYMGRAHIANLTKDLDAMESWSEDLGFDAKH